MQTRGFRRNRISTFLDFEESLALLLMMEEDKVREEGGYLFVCMDENAKEEGVELPLEDDGTMLLSVLQSQFNGSSGLKYRQA